MPLSRSAGRATTAPIAATINIAAIRVTMLPPPGSFDISAAPRPANVSGASEISPAYPVSGTSERAAMAKIKALLSESRSPRPNQPEMPITNSIPTTTPKIDIGQFGSGVVSRRCSSPPPRRRLWGSSSRATNNTIIGTEAADPRQREVSRSSRRG